SGGADPDSNSDARARAPLSVSTLGRIVSLSDYENFTLSFAGIAKACVKQLWNGKQKLAHITIAAAGGVPIDENSILYRNLAAAIDANRDIPAPYVLQTYESLNFNLTAVVIADPGLDPGPLKKQIEEILTDTFSFEKRQLGQDVSASEIIALIQEIDGVTAVLLEQLYIINIKTQDFNEILEAHAAYWDSQSGEIHPAQLLWFDPQKGNITLNME
ncbi:MAG: baseplate J/gp47 family protein, partial [Acidobacteria bacterium]|nr:baseplate J/gp47 family protein [Acidobacteriota bacterium]